MAMFETNISYLGILISAVVSMIIGALWYGPLFGKPWMKMMGLTKKDMEKAKKKGMWKLYLANFIAVFVMAFVLMHIIIHVGAVTIWEGVQTGFWVWLGFIATVMLGTVIWEGKPLKLYLLNVGYYLISLLVMGAILVSFA